MSGVLGDSVHGKWWLRSSNCRASRVSRALHSSEEAMIVAAGGDLAIAELISSANPCAADSWSGDSAHTRMARATDSNNLRICSKGRWPVLFEDDK